MLLKAFLAAAMRLVVCLVDQFLAPFHISTISLILESNTSSSAQVSLASRLPLIVNSQSRASAACVHPCHSMLHREGEAVWGSGRALEEPWVFWNVWHRCRAKSAGT